MGLIFAVESIKYNARPNNLPFKKHSLGKSRAKEAIPNSQRTFAAVCKAFKPIMNVTSTALLLNCGS